MGRISLIFFLSAPEHTRPATARKSGDAHNRLPAKDLESRPPACLVFAIAAAIGPSSVCPWHKPPELVDNREDMVSTREMHDTEDIPGGQFCCVACGAHEVAPGVVMRAEADRRPFDLVRCDHCGLVQQFPRYSEAQLRSLYSGDYYVFDEEEPQRWARAVQQYAVHLLRLEPAKGRRVLDIGCALGHFSALAAHRGWRVVGIDLSADAVSRAARQFKLDFHAGDAFRFLDALPPFDVIFMGDVLEHVQDPQSFIRRIRRALSPGGIVCIDTPNWSSWWRRLGRSRWLGLNRFHINLFDSDSLEHLLAAVGCREVTTCAYTNYRYEAWTSRPELQAILGMLPGAIAWRLNRLLNKRNKRGPWHILRANPPSTIEAASQLLDEIGMANVPKLSKSGDNLIAMAS